jgi:xylose dehydrogenase (NAD/NADP)
MSQRIGIVGTGGISRAHGRAAQAVENAELCAICDLSPEALEVFGEEFQVEGRYLDVEEMLAAADLDIAIVSTWGSTHAELVQRIAATRKVRAILCEKPISSTAAECEAMFASAHANDVLLAEAFKFRYHPQHIKAKELVQEGAIGQLYNIRSTFTVAVNPLHRTPASNWRFNPQQGGGAVYDLGCYNLHHARFIVGAEPVQLFALGVFGEPSGVDESTAVLLEFPGKISAHFSLSHAYFNTQYVEISGNEGMVRIPEAWNNENRPIAIELHNRDGIQQFDFEPVDQFALQLEHLCTTLDEGTPHRIPAENSLANMRAIDAIFTSINTGQPVKLA